MKETPSPFCPSTCLFQGEDCPEECNHFDDTEFQPYTIHIKGQAVTVVGRNHEWLYVQYGGEHPYRAQIHQNAPFIEW